jgi:BMFP domain-containing protein YqiC
MLSRGAISRFFYQGEEAVVRLITKLENRIEDLEAMHASASERRIASLSKEIARLKDQLPRQTEELLQERQQNHLLVARIRELEREIEHGPSVTKDSHNSSLPPSSDRPWAKVKRTQSLRRKSGKKVGGQPGHKGSTLLQVTEPDEIIVHRPETCAGCGASLEGADTTGDIAGPRRQVFDFSDGRVKVTEHRVEISRCHACGATTRASFPHGVLTLEPTLLIINPAAHKSRCPAGIQTASHYWMVLFAAVRDVTWVGEFRRFCSSILTANT